MSESVQVVCPHCDATNRVPRARLADGPRCGGCRQALFVAKPVMLDEARFRKHLEHSGIPLLVDFWASWCAPCREMAPEFDAAARELEPQMRLVKVNTEEARALAQEMRIMSIPTLMFFGRGLEWARQPGALPAQRIVEWARETQRMSAGR